jgi:hypothetical protein
MFGRNCFVVVLLLIVPIGFAAFLYFAVSPVVLFGFSVFIYKLFLCLWLLPSLVYRLAHFRSVPLRFKK